MYRQYSPYQKINLNMIIIELLGLGLGFHIFDIVITLKRDITIHRHASGYLIKVNKRSWHLL
jgi:hypothetical protein